MREFEDEIIFPREIKIDENANLPELVSILPVRNTVLFPFSMLPLTVGRGSSIQLIEDLKPNHHRFLGVVTQRNPAIDNPQEIDLFSIGTLGVAAKEIRVNENSLVVFVQGVKRFRIK